jgi:predicted O-linked N-acetylglucosamine transferase (SPINDLY family)
MTTATTLPPVPAAAEPPSLAAARAREAAGDPKGADAIYAALYNQQAPDPAMMIAWSRLRRRVGDAQNASTMLEVASRAGGGAPVLIEMASMMIDQGRAEQAGALLRQAATAGRSIGLDYEAARWEAARGRLAEAAALFRAVVKAEPRHMEARYGLARTLVLLGQPAEAEGAYSAMLKRDPGNPRLMSELAYLYGTQRRFAQALELYERLGETGLELVREFSQVALGMMHVADWSAREHLTAKLAARMATGRPAIFEPFALLAATDDPALHRRMAETYAAALRAASLNRERPAPRALSLDVGNRRLRIGYLCGDFMQHATGLLIAGVIEAHDRDAFELFAYDYSPEDGSPTRARLVAAFEHFVRLGDESPSASAARIAADDIDILVDLKGYTERSRTEILTLRPAPIQAAFLGYPGTQGAEWVDFIIADAAVLPPEQEIHYAEQPVRLPFSCYPSDRGRPTPAPDTDRAAHGLPAEGMVFACFNNPFKIAPAVFGAWMEILRRAEGSVLWLYEGNPLVGTNLRAAAKQAGIDPARLIFAQPATLEAHIARHGCADLFLDTAPYGAHTTALDALWAGLPLLTCAGESWASRVGASLLHAVGLPQLVTTNLTAYTELALTLAADRVFLQSLRTHLVQARQTSPLFDAVAFARALERGYRQMVEVRQGKV